MDDQKISVVFFLQRLSGYLETGFIYFFSLKVGEKKSLKGFYLSAHLLFY